MLISLIIICNLKKKKKMFCHCSYYDQLVLLESKVPAHEFQVPFKWKDAFDKGSFFGTKIGLSECDYA